MSYAVPSISQQRSVMTRARAPVEGSGEGSRVSGATSTSVRLRWRFGFSSGDKASVIADASGAKLAEAPQDADAVLTASFDLEALALQRANWHVFRDRRPELYSALCTYDGVLPQR